MATEVSIGHYTVQSGDCLRSIGRSLGLPWRKIYDHAQNKAFRDLRPNPHVIYPGDRLFIPDLEPDAVSADTEQKHRFKLNDDGVMFTLFLEDEEGNALTDQPFSIEVEKRAPIKSRTNANGMLRVPIQPQDTDATLTVWVERQDDQPVIEHIFELRLGELDPISTDTGLQARLYNLGFDPGPIDGVVGPLTKRAVKDFQRDMSDLKVDGIAGRVTRQRLEKEHRS
jgi:N-acetylmuramoyl-L-alanine amidase